MDPEAPARPATLQEPRERMEDTRERPPAVPQGPLEDPEEKVGVQIWVAIDAGRGRLQFSSEPGFWTVEASPAVYIHSLRGVGMLHFFCSWESLFLAQKANLIRM